MRLIDADALKTSVPKTSADIFENCRNCKLLDDWKVKELIDNAPTVEPAPRWHRVEEPPKEEHRTYLVYTDTGYMCSCRWTNNVYGLGESDRWGWSIADVPQFQNVTHWMPIEPPKEVTNE